jgi:hypothetical protein
MGLNSNALISIDDIREALGLESEEVKDDGFLISLINRASQRIESYCGRTFNVAYYTEYHDGDGTPEVLLDQYPITYVSGLWDDIDRAFGSDYEISSADYLIYANEGRLSLYNDETTFCVGRQNIKVCYSGGYTTIPDDLKEACIDLALTRYRRSKEKTHGVSSRATAGGSSAMFDLRELPIDVKAILDTYKKPKTNSERN